MLSSKANAALTRLKEIEEKYKIKRKEQRWKRKEGADSSISSISLENLSSQLEKSQRNSLKPKLNVKMPDMRFEQPVESAESSQNKESDSMRQTIDSKADIKVTMPPESNLPLHSAEKQESFVSDITTIQENSSIESALDDTMTSSKTLSRLETSHRQFPTSNDRSSRHEGKPKVSIKSRKGKESDEIFEISDNKSSSDNSSSAKHSKIFEKSSEKISRSHSDLISKERSIEKKKIVKSSKISSSNRNSKHSIRSGSSRDNSIIDESIVTIENGSEILLELSHVEESISDKTNRGTVNISGRSEHLTAENSYDNVSNIGPKQLIAESGYVNDTFEDISSSIVQSKSRSQNETIINEKTETINLTISHKVDDVENELNKKPSNHVVDFDRTDKVKVSKVNDEVSRKKNSLMELTLMSLQESHRKERRKSSGKMKERSMINTIVLLAASDEETVESTKSLEEKNEENKENKNISEGSSDRCVSQNVTSALRKMHRDVIYVANSRRMTSQSVRKMYEGSSEKDIKFEVQDAKKMITREGNQHHSSKKNKTFIHSLKESKKKAKVTNAELIEPRDYTRSCNKGKTLRYNRKQIRELQKRVVELRLQQERKDLQKYLYELKNLRLGGYVPTPNYFSPLEFPKIVEFTPSDVIDFESNPDDQLDVLREKVSAIRRWLKDQYILYRDYCAVARAINAGYVPTTLEDTKKVPYLLPYPRTV